MNYKEFLKSIVEAETEDERFEIVKEHSDTFNPENAEKIDVDSEIATATEALNAKISELETSVSELKQEIKDRFFGDFENPAENEAEKTDEEIAEEAPENPDEEVKTLNDLGFGNKHY